MTDRFHYYRFDETGKITSIISSNGGGVVLDEGDPYVVVARSGTPRDPEAWRVVNGKLRRIPKSGRDRHASKTRLLNTLRAARDERLADSDKSILPDRWEAMTPEQRAAWAAYRQALRDLPMITDPANPVWPTPPN